MVPRKSDVDNKVTIDLLKSKVEELERRSNYQEDYNRRNNLRISGIREQQGGETWEETEKTISEILVDKLELPPIKTERVHRTELVAASRPRTVVVKFERFGDREAVIRNARKLKGSSIYINEDLFPASLELKKNQISLMKMANEERKTAFFKHTRLIIKERPAQCSEADSGELSESRSDGSRGLRSAGAVAGGVEGWPEVESDVVGVGGGMVAPSTTRAGAADLVAQSPPPAGGAAVPHIPADGAPSPGVGWVTAASSGRTPDGPGSVTERGGDAIQQRNRKKYNKCCSILLCISSLYNIMEINVSVCDELPFAALSNDSFHSIICIPTPLNNCHYNLEYDPFATYDKYDNLLCADEFYLRNRFTTIPKYKFVFLDNTNFPSTTTF